MNLKQRLSALELTKQVKPLSPIIIIVDGEITDSQWLEITEAEKAGQKVVLIMCDDC